MKKLILIAAAAIAVTTPAHAKTWTLDECIGYAVENNIRVKEARVQELSGEYDVTQAKDQFLPNLSANASQTFNFGRGLTSENIYADRNTSNFQWGVGMQLPLFQGLEATRQLKYARVNLRSLALRTEAARENITLNVIAQYLQALYCRELLATANEQVRLSEYELTRQEALAEAGKIAEVNVLQAKSQVAQDRLSVTNAQNDYTLALLDLAQLIQLSDIEEFDIKPLDNVIPVVPSVETVYADATLGNSGLLEAQNNVAVAQAQESVARTGYIPRLSFNAGIGSSYYHIGGFDNASFSRQMRDNYSTYFGFSLQIPIFDAFSTRNRVRKAQVQTLTARLQLQDTQTQLYKDIQQAYYRAVAAHSKFQTGVTSEDLAREAFEAMKEKYEMGRATPQEFEQSKTTYLKSTIERIQANYEYILRCRILNFYSNSGRS
ncbi:MAG: TolC family protein [Muribaculaceae bacterium]|nr:TolC family protein [Muribaculaceae bacterium]